MDDCSNDNTFKEAKNNGIIVLRHIVNLGKGAALKLKADYTIFSEEILILFKSSSKKIQKSLVKLSKSF